MTNSTRRALCAAGLLAFVAIPASAATNAAKTGSCSPTTSKYIVSPGNVASHTGTIFATLPQASVSFKQGGTSASCVKVSFVAMTDNTADPNSQIQIRAVLDGGTLAASPIGYFDNTVGGAQSYVFIFPDVAPGPHNLKIEYATNNVAYTATIFDHTTIVEYTK